MVRSHERDELLIIELPYIEIATTLKIICFLFFKVSVLPEGNLVQPGPALA